MQDVRNNDAYAMKVLDRKRVKKMHQERRLETEKELLRQMKSPFICRLFADTEDDSAFYLLMEFVNGGELQRLIHPRDLLKRGQQQADVDRGLCAGIPHQPAKFYVAAVSLPLVCMLCFNNIAVCMINP
jgi:serine/threonine protein kinase